jgi:hypothetical protein
MKIKRDKAIKRRMTILGNTFGFKKPYKVLCDGNFLQVRQSIPDDDGCFSTFAVLESLTL